MSIPLFDLHQDLLSHLKHKEHFGQSDQTDFASLKEQNVRCLSASAFPIPKNEDWLDPVCNSLLEEELREYVSHAQTHQDWMIVKSGSDLQQVFHTKNLHGLLLHIEGLNCFDGSPKAWEMLARWYDLGLRSVGIVWNSTNSLGGGTNDPTQGLTPLGREVITWLNDKNMIVDYAHMNAPTFSDVVQETSGPIVISHGNSCAVCPSPRNYTDEQLKLLSKRDGVIGVYFAKTYLTGVEPASIEHVLHHLDHLINVAGSDHVGIGTDFGGIITGHVDALTHVRDLPNLWQAMETHGYSHELIEKIAYKNALRVYSSILPYTPQ